MSMKCYHCGKELKDGDTVVSIELLKMNDVYGSGYSGTIKGEAFFHLRCFLRANLKVLILGWKIKGESLTLRARWK